MGGAVNIEDNHLDIAEEVWKRRRQTRPFNRIGFQQPGLFSFLDSFLEDASFSRERPLRDRPLYLIAFQSHLSPEADNALRWWKENQGLADNETIDCYENWDDKIPENAYLREFYCDPQGRVKFNGLYWTGKGRISVPFNYLGKGRDRGSIQVVFKQDRYEGMGIIAREGDEFTQRIRRYLVEQLGQNEEQGADNALSTTL